MHAANDGFRFPPDTMKELLAADRIIFGDDETKLIELKVYAKDYRAKLASLFELDGRVGTNEIKNIFPDDNRPFDFPKPTELVEELISFTTSGSDIVLDTFAGSGTTAHAVLKLNRADGQKRRFVVAEMKQKIVDQILIPRVSRAISGYQNASRQAVPGLGGGFQFCRLSPRPLFDSNGEIRSGVAFGELAEFVWFAETGIGFFGMVNSPLLGIHEGRAIYLLYNGILKDKSISGGNVLTGPVYSILPKHDGPKVIYAAACRLGAARLARDNILFKQTPYALEV